MQRGIHLTVQAMVVRADCANSPFLRTASRKRWIVSSIFNCLPTAH